MYKDTQVSGVLFELIVKKKKNPLSQIFYTSAAIDAMDKYQVWESPWQDASDQPLGSSLVHLWCNPI